VVSLWFRCLGFAIAIVCSFLCGFEQESTLHCGTTLISYRTIICLMLYGHDYVPPLMCPGTAPLHLQIQSANSRCPIYSSRRVQLQLCGLWFTTDAVQCYLGMRLDDNNLRLGGHTSEHSASRRSFQGNTPKTRIHVLDPRCT